MGVKDNSKLILRRLDEVEESVNLGTLDTTILGMMIFLFATMLSLVSMGFPKFIVNNPYVFTMVYLFILFIIPFIQFIIEYAQTIIYKEGRFTKKKFILMMLSGEFLLMVLLWIFLGIAWIYEHWWKTPQWVVITVMITLLVVSILVMVFYFKSKINDYFNENFKALLARRNKELKKNKQLLHKTKK